MSKIQGEENEDPNNFKNLHLILSLPPPSHTFSSVKKQEAQGH